MHYDFKSKLNKIDSQQYRNLRIPEIDWVLNEAQELFVKMIAKPRLRNNLGFESSQRSIDDIRSIVVRDYEGVITDNVFTLPEDYWFYISSKVLMDKGACEGVLSNNLNIRQHEDEFEASVFDNSSFEWREVNGVFYNEGIKLFDDGTFINKSLSLNYIKKLVYLHNAEDFPGGTYTLPSGAVLSGVQNSELPEGVHREIVDIAVYLASTNINAQDQQLKFNKLMMNNLK